MTSDLTTKAAEIRAGLVEPLEWQVEHGYVARAESPVEIYAIHEFVSSPEPFRLMGVGHRSLYFDTLDEAKAAAQSDYEARIRASLALEKTDGR